MLNEKALPRQQTWVLPTIAAGTNATYALFNPRITGEFLNVQIASHAAVATDANSFCTVRIIDNTTTTHTMASFNTGATTGVSLTLDTFQTIALSGTVTNKRFNNGDAIIITKADTGGGTTLTTPTLWVEWMAADAGA